MGRRATLDAVRSRMSTLRRPERHRSARAGVPADGQREPWRGSGGRWVVWTFRFVVWAVLLIVGYPRGHRHRDAGQNSSGSSGAPAADPIKGFPVAMAEAYALQFGSVYLNFSPADADQRAKALAAFLPPGPATSSAGTAQARWSSSPSRSPGSRWPTPSTR